MEKQNSSCEAAMPVATNQLTFPITAYRPFETLEFLNWLHAQKDASNPAEIHEILAEAESMIRVLRNKHDMAIIEARMEGYARGYTEGRNVINLRS